MFLSRLLSPRTRWSLANGVYVLRKSLKASTTSKIRMIVPRPMYTTELVPVNAGSVPPAAVYLLRLVAYTRNVILARDFQKLTSTNRPPVSRDLHERRVIGDPQEPHRPTLRTGRHHPQRPPRRLPRRARGSRRARGLQAGLDVSRRRLDRPRARRHSTTPTTHRAPRLPVTTSARDSPARRAPPAPLNTAQASTGTLAAPPTRSNAVTDAQLR